MAFPSVTATGDVYSATSAITAHPLDLPAGVGVGALLVGFVAVRSNGTSTWPAGWTKVVDDVDVEAPAVGFGAIAIKRIQGGDPEIAGSTITVTTSESVRAVGVVWRISGYHAVTNPSASTATGDNAGPNPPSHSPAEAGTEDRLWVAFHATENAIDTTGFPAEFVSNQAEAVSGTTGGTRVAFAVATRDVSAATEDPGSFIIPANRGWMAATVAVRPGGEGFVTVTGAGVGAFTFTGAAEGKTSNVTGSATGAFAFTGSALGDIAGSPPTGLPSITASGGAYVGDASITTHLINCPAHTAGQRLMLLMAWDGDPAVVSVSAVGGDAWTLVADAPADNSFPSTVASLFVYEIAARTGPGASQDVTVTLSTAEAGTARIVAISDAHGTTATAAATSTGLGNSTSPNPPALDPTGWELEHTLWLAVEGHDSTGSVTTYPIGFDGNQTNINTTNINSATLSYATHDERVTTLDPGPFTITNSRNWAAVTLAVRPAVDTGSFGQAVGAFTSSGTATGTVTQGVTGTASGAFVFTGTALGVGGTNVQGQAVGAFVFAGTAQGQGGSAPNVNGVAVGAFVFVASASGEGGTGSVLVFTPPTTDGIAMYDPAMVRTSGAHALWRHYGAWAMGQTVWKDSQGIWHAELYPYQGGAVHRVFKDGVLISESEPDEGLATAQKVYLGGHDTVITQAEADDLIEAGFGDGIHQEAMV